MSTYQPKKIIPDSWANLAACPICEVRGLSVFRQPGQADQLACSNCQVSFELEQDGPNIRMIMLPPDYAVFLQPAWQTWMSVYEIRKQIKTGLASHHNIEDELPATVSPPVEMVTRQMDAPANFTFSAPEEDLLRQPISQEEVNLRASGLSSLGNTTQEIRTTLEHLNATPEQIDTALASLASQRKKGKTNTPRNMIFVLLALIVCLGVTALVLPLMNIPGALKSIEPVWNYIQNTLSNSDPFGGVTGARRVPTAAPTAQPRTLSAEGRAYFDTVFSISQKSTWAEKYDALNDLVPPVELLSAHEEILNHYLFLAVLESANEKNNAIKDELCATTRAVNTGACDRVEKNDFALQVQYLSEENAINSWWTGGPCKVFRTYFQGQDVPFPYAAGQCSLP